MAKSKRKAEPKKEPTVLLPAVPPEAVRMSYKYRIWPTEEQKAYFELNFDACRYVYNHYLRCRQDAYEATCEQVWRPKPALDEDGNPKIDEQGREVWERKPDGKVAYHKVDNPGYDPNAKRMSFFDTSKDLTAFKKVCKGDDGAPWLAKADSTALVYSLRNIETAYQNFFRGLKTGVFTGYPRFKKASARKSFKVAGAACEVGPSWVRLPKCGKVRATVHRECIGRVVSVSVSRDGAGRYFAAVNVDGAPAPKFPEPAAGEVGVTMGIERWAVDSDGEVYERPREEARKRLERRIAFMQWQLSQKQGYRKGEPKSNEFRKKARQIARAQARLADMRADDTHKLTRRIVEEHEFVYCRRMGTQGMDKSGRSADAPGALKRAVRKGNRDSNYFEFNRELAYKAAWAGRGFVELPELAPTAMTCSECGHVEESVGQTWDQSWTCPACGAVHDRKGNGAQNVLDAGAAAMRAAMAAPAEKDVAAEERPK